jgi:hypothetical protein
LVPSTGYGKSVDKCHGFSDRQLKKAILRQQNAAGALEKYKSNMDEPGRAIVLRNVERTSEKTKTAPSMDSGRSHIPGADRSSRF